MKYYTKTMEGDKIKLTIVYDNVVYKKDIGLKPDWGFSCLIETENETVLFDTGARGDILLSNMENIGIDPKSIGKIVISHEHWDHNGGLKALVPVVSTVGLYRLENKTLSKNMCIISVENPLKITEGIYTTGRLRGSLDEQSLVLKGDEGLYVLVGCSHPGVEKTLNAAKQYGGIVGLVGGFHGFNNFSIFEGLDFICPCHCTKYIKKIHELYPRTCVEGGVGQIIEI